MGQDKVDVFAQGCVKLLFNCLQNLKMEKKNANEISLAANELKSDKLKALSILTG